MQKELISKTDKIFIAGHKGMAGSAINRALIKKGFNNILTENRSKLDLENEISVREWFTKKNLM